MKRIAILRWFGACALGLSLVTGCSHSRSGSVGNGTPVACANCGCANGSCQTAVAAGQPGAARTVPMYTSSASVPAPGYAAVPTPPMYQSSVVQAAAKEEKEVETAGPAVAPESVVKSPFTRGEPNPPRKSYVDITASSCFEHSPDYTTISGELTHCRTNNTWRLRYLSVDETDPYGGSVTLTGDSTQLSTLKDGQCIRVQGRLSHPEQKAISPAFRVESVEVLK